MLETNWRNVTGYNSTAVIYTLTVEKDGIVSYTKYRVRISALNAYGSSEWSPTMDFAVAALPSAPSAPVKVQRLSTKSSIYVKWANPISDIEIITGF